jgi:superkiller protein 3
MKNIPYTLRVIPTLCLIWVASVSSPGQLGHPALGQPATVSSLQQAQQTLKAGQYYQAEHQLQQIVKQYPNSAEAWFNLGLSLHLQMKLHEAITTYQQAIQLDPTYDQPYTNMGLALIESNDLEKASTVFRQVLTLPERPESPASIHTLAHYNLAIILKRQGKQTAAIQEVEAALAITPNFPQAQQLRKQLL